MSKFLEFVGFVCIVISGVIGLAVYFDVLYK